MSGLPKQDWTRREVLQTAGTIAASAAALGALAPAVYAAGTDTIQLALVGAGDRGSGAAANALSTTTGPTKLVAMADVFPERLSRSHAALAKRFSKQVDVPTERQFIGFDSYKQAMDCLRPGDVVLLTTPPAFRGVHFAYAIEKGLNVFMEKPVTVDGPGTRKMLKLAELSEQKGLKVGVGLMCRHCKARGELFDRIQSGQIGDLVLLRAYRTHGPLGHAFVPPKPEGISELMYQIQKFHAFLWASGGCFSDFMIHNIDECCWMKNAWPVEAKAYGGRHYRGKNIDQNFDVYTVEYTFADGSKFMLEGRCMEGCQSEFSSYAHGSKGSAIISASNHFPARSRIFKGQKFVKEDVVWSYGKPEGNPYEHEWNDLLAAIRNGKPYNEVRRGAEASLVTSMGRMAAHTGQIVKYADMLNCEHEFATGLDKLTMASSAPLQMNADGKYPVPQPGITRNREY